jgi:Holliday junction resolvase RusA-like endonuclease
VASPETARTAPGGDRGGPQTDRLGSAIDLTNSPPQDGLQPPVTIVIAGPATAKGRARATRAGVFYTPAKTRAYEAHGRFMAQLEMAGRAPLTGPVKLIVLVVLAVPSSWSGRRRAAAITGEIRPTARPDLDNFVKSAADAINGICIIDDSQITEIQAQKRYGVEPKLVMTIEPIAALPSNVVRKEFPAPAGKPDPQLRST